MCKVLMVSSSGYYSWKTRPLSQRKLFDKYLLGHIRQVHLDSRQNYGAIKTWKALKARGIACGKNRIARIRKMAIERRQPQSEVIHHTDRGSIYGSDDYRSKLVSSGLVPSMSRKGDCMITLSPRAFSVH
jgi:putative transposase